MNPADLNDAYKSMAAEAVSALFAASVALLQSEDGKRVLARLKADQRAHDALDAIVKTGEDLDNLLLACVQADRLMRTLPQKLKTEHESLDRLSSLGQSLDDLERFIDEVCQPPADPFARKVTIRPEYLVIVRGAFRVMRYVLDSCRRAARETPARLGATRKSAGTTMAAAKIAAENVAIGWIAAAVENMAGRPLTQHVAVLAEVALDIGEVSEGRVQHALKTRRQKRRDVESGAFGT